MLQQFLGTFNIDAEAAVKLGADVPFNLNGGRALVRGVGEVVEPLRYQEKAFTLLSFPTVGCSTADVYRKWDELGGPAGPNGNDLELAALSVCPELSVWRDELEKHTGVETETGWKRIDMVCGRSFSGEGFITAQTLQSFAEESAQDHRT